jgi:hypothetical protein
MWCCVDRRFESSDENKNKIRELAALVRTAADAIGRAAELMLQFNLCEAFEDERCVGYG